MSVKKLSFDDQIALLMQGIEFGDDEIKDSMQAELTDRIRESERNGIPLRVYCGFDPTAPDLHLGHTVPMNKLRQFQELGHQVIFVIGSFTALVGDPSDKDKARPRRTEEEILANARTYTDQVFKILDREKTEVRYNHEWLADVKLADFVEMASLFTVQQFLVRDNFSARFEKGNPIWLHEFFYAILQGYDATVLEADVQLGATEQLFNLLAGRKLQESFGMKPQVALTLPVLVGTDGHMRMSKTTGNYIGIDETPEEMYGKVMSIPDSAMLDYFQLVTRLGPEEIKHIEADLSSGAAHPRDVKMRLAREIVGIYHGEAAVKPAEDTFVLVFQDKGMPEDMPEFILRGGESILDIMVASEAASSRSEARRLIEQRGVRIDGEVVEDEGMSLVLESPAVLRVGKRRFIRLIPPARN
jgi:tyrosyl-tRNA synthetase